MGEIKQKQGFNGFGFDFETKKVFVFQKGLGQSVLFIISHKR